MSTTKSVVGENVLEGRDAGPRLTARMVHHAAQVICACMVGADGLTPLRRFKGRTFGTPLAGFGERVWLRDPVLERVNKFNPRCTEVRLLGFCLESSRYIVVDFDGRFRMVQTVKRANADDRWKVVSPRDPFQAAELASTPAEFTCSRGTRRKVNPAAERMERHPVDTLPPDPIRDPVPRRLYLKHSDFLAHETSGRCLGCRALVIGGRAQGHTEECGPSCQDGGERRYRQDGSLRRCPTIRCCGERMPCHSHQMGHRQQGGPMTLLSYVLGRLPRSSVVVAVTNTSTSQRHLTYRKPKL